MFYNFIIFCHMLSGLLRCLQDVSLFHGELSGLLKPDLKEKSFHTAVRCDLSHLHPSVQGHHCYPFTSGLTEE